MSGALTMNTEGTTEGILEVSSASGGGIQLTSGTKPTCDSTTRFLFWVVAGGTGIKDTVEVCAKAADGSFAWRTVY